MNIIGPCTQSCSTAHLVFSDLCTNKFPFINSYDNLELRLCLKLSVCWMPWLISLKLPLVYLLSICYHSFLLFLLSYFPILHSSPEFPLKVGKKINIRMILLTPCVWSPLKWCPFSRNHSQPSPHLEDK